MEFHLEYMNSKKKYSINDFLIHILNTIEEYTGNLDELHYDISRAINDFPYKNAILIMENHKEDINYKSALRYFNRSYFDGKSKTEQIETCKELVFKRCCYEWYNKYRLEIYSIKNPITQDINK